MSACGFKVCNGFMFLFNLFLVQPAFLNFLLLFLFLLSFPLLTLFKWIHILFNVIESVKHFFFTSYFENFPTYRKLSSTINIICPLPRESPIVNIVKHCVYLFIRCKCKSIPVHSLRVSCEMGWNECLVLRHISPFRFRLLRSFLQWLDDLNHSTCDLSGTRTRSLISLFRHILLPGTGDSIIPSGSWISL